ncbi:R3H domain-containing protein 4 [Toxocara canis]|uniref:R3H domain-containing protein 4 n=1 Tax=Toxocara canis TaxID=6265 RepID=A0A0B2V2N1_TOXCA|nr:R3H domain-containing protein 4 [Toxocara canis]
MGVLRVNDLPKPVRLDEGIITYEDYIFDDDDNESYQSESENQQANEMRSAPTTPARRRRQKETRAERKIRRFLELDSQNGGMKIKRRMGARKMRRLENAKFMYALADPEDICDDFSDILPSTVTAFAQLFIEQQNMRAWNEFIEKDEDEQRAFLENAVRHTKNSEKVYEIENRIGGRQERSTINFARNKQQEEEARQHHPAYSAAACFSRMDQRFKTIFAQKHLPWSFISSSEQELRAYFLSCASPESQWCSAPIPSAWHRLLLHGVSQYLSLHSTSVRNDEGEKFLQVHNERAYFIPPHNNLVAFIAQIHKNERRKWSIGL